MELQDDGSHLLFLSNGNTQVVTFGCTNPEYAEFDEDATIDDGSCSTIAVFGCTNPSYEEFSSSANSDDGSCLTLAPLCANPTLDGHAYAVTIIGDQCWFAENLRTTVYDNGEEILEPHQGNYAYLYQHNDGRQIAYAGDQANVQEWGRLYNWHAVNDERGLCPSGWHVPSNADWDYLLDHLGGANVAGQLLADNNGWFAPNVGLEGTTGFNAPGSGYQPNGNNGSRQANQAAWFWSSDILTSSSAWAHEIRNPLSEVDRDTRAPNYGLSVRCIKDGSLAGCTDPNFIEYQSWATEDDGSCATAVVQGCTNDLATNFDPTANFDDGSCEGLGACAGQLAFTYDSYQYPLTAIGDQCWFAENLQADNYSNGESIIEPRDDHYAYLYQHNDGRQIAYAGDQANVQEWGRLYNWHAVNDERGLCPSGWHVPSNADWDYLLDHLGGANVAGQLLADNNGWFAPNVGLEGTTGFNAPGSGYQPNGNNGSRQANQAAWFWSSDILTSSSAWAHEIRNPLSEVDRDTRAPNYGLSVRCIKDGSLAGCTDPNFIEYQSWATEDDGSCATAVVQGCTNDLATNFDPTANFDDGSCEGLGACAGQLAFTYDSYQYPLTAIGDQCWFAENLQADNYSNGESIIEPRDDHYAYLYQHNDGRQIAYAGDQANVQEWGRLYNWHAVNDERGLCPSGWHVPSNADWDYLLDHLGGANVAGQLLADNNGWFAPNVGLEGTTGFNAPGSGYQPNGNNGSRQANQAAWFWSSDILTSSSAWAHEIRNPLSEVDRDTRAPNYGLSVRCIKDGSLAGCTDPNFIEYQSWATEDDGSCATAVVQGCTNDLATNFDPTANFDDGSCEGLGACAGQLAFTYDSYQYPLTAIGDQCWFAENLQADNYSNGESIIEPRDDHYAYLYQHNDGRQIAYAGDQANVQEWGRLYNWHAVNDERGLCPSGWHVPSNADWDYLLDHLGGANVAGQLLADNNGWFAPNVGLEGTTGFNAPGSGYQPNGNNGSRQANQAAWFWSSDILTSSSAWAHEIRNPLSEVDRDTRAPNYGLSVRCIKDGSLAGCTDPNFIEYQSWATEDDGSCATAVVQGCTNDLATNFDPTANFDDGSCEGLGACAGQLAFTYDSYQYPLTAIGDQCWFAENLQADNYSNGESIIEPRDDHYAYLYQHNDGRQIAYAGDQANVQEWGRLYNWHAVNDERGLCPSGWHVPSNADWDYLLDHLGGANVAGQLLADNNGWFAPNVGLEGTTGFNAPGSGYQPNGNNGSRQANQAAWFWSSDILTSSSAWAHEIRNPLSEVDRDTRAPNYGLSVRCIKDGSLAGCTDPNFIEYQSWATEDDGSCATAVVQGCTNDLATNFDPTANFDDGSCEGLGACAGQLAFTYDSYQYPLTAIGDQCWFAENLQADNYSNGESIIEPRDDHYAYLYQHNDGRQIAYAGDQANVQEWGRLYNWHAVNDERGLCPSGWHVPSNADWDYLLDHLGGANVAGQLLADNNGWFAPNVGLEGTTGFNAPGSGYQPNGNNGSRQANQAAWFWSSDILTSSSAWAHEIRNPLSEVDRDTRAPNYGLSVRCIKDGSLAGCTDPNFIEYQSWATEDDGSCATAVVQGCTNDLATNFDPTANFDDGSCEGLGACAGQLAFTYDSYQYPLTAIGDQCWFAENLQADNYSNGESIIEPRDDHYAYLYQHNDGRQIAYAGDQANVQEWGRLYNWHAVNDERGLCPSGWHVPSNADWDYLLDHLGGANVAGQLLADNNGWFAPNVGLEGTTGFNAPGSGYQPNGNNGSRQANQAAWFWSSDILTSSSAWAHEIRNPLSEVDRDTRAPNYGLSVRCIKDGSLAGCTDPNFIEYQSWATEDDGSCATAVVQGCTNDLATNFDPTANFDDGSCEGLGACAGQLAFTYDSYQYPLTAIGDQCWFAENLQADNYSNGESIIEPRDDYYVYLYQHNDGRQIAYAGDQANVQEWGRLYNWHAVNDERGLCPSGWHVPSLEDIEDLIDFSGSTFEAGLTLKSIEQWPAPNVGATNELEFSAVPSGSQPNCNCGSTGGGTSFTIWTRNFNTEGLIPTLQITSNSSEAMWSSSQVNEGNSVRCIKD